MDSVGLVLFPIAHMPSEVKPWKSWVWSLVVINTLAQCSSHLVTSRCFNPTLAGFKPLIYRLAAAFLVGKVLAYLKYFNLLEWGSIRCKHIVKGQRISQIKARLLGQVENVFSHIKTQQATSGTSAAIYKLMEPHCSQRANLLREQCSMDCHGGHD